MNKLFFTAIFITLGLIVPLGCSDPAPPPLQTDVVANALQGRWTTPRPARDLPSLQAVAEVVAHPFSVVVVSSPVEGRLVEVRRAPGDNVIASDVIAVVQSVSLATAAADYVGRQREIQQLDARFEQLKKLQKTGLARRDSLFQLEMRRIESISARERAAATLRAAGASPSRAASIAGGGGRQFLVAASDGVVTELHRSPGEGVSVGDSIASIAHQASTRIRAHLPAALLDAQQLTFTSSHQKWEVERAALAPSVRVSDQTRLAWFDVVVDTSSGGAPPLVGARGILSPPTLDAETNATRESDASLWAVPRASLRRDAQGTTLTVRRAGKHLAERAEVMHSDDTTSVVRAALFSADEVLVYEPGAQR